MTDIDPCERARDLASGFRGSDAMSTRQDEERALHLAEEFLTDAEMVVGAIADLDVHAEDTDLWRATVERRLSDLEAMVMGLLDEVHGRLPRAISVVMHKSGCSDAMPPAGRHVSELAGRLWEEVLVELGVGYERRRALGPSPTGWRCVGCDRPSSPSVRCECGVTVSESSGCGPVDSGQ